MYKSLKKDLADLFFGITLGVLFVVGVVYPDRTCGADNSCFDLFFSDPEDNQDDKTYEDYKDYKDYGDYGRYEDGEDYEYYGEYAQEEEAKVLKEEPKSKKRYFRVNEINNILLQLADMWEMKYQQDLSEKEEISYFFRGVDLTYKEVDILEKRLKRFMVDYLEQIFFRPELQSVKNNDQDPYPVRFVVITLMQILGNSRGKVYFDKGDGQKYYFATDFEVAHPNVKYGKLLRYDVLWSYIPESLQKKLIYALTRYYSNFISDRAKINPASKIYYDIGELQASLVLTEELEYKKIIYKEIKNHIKRIIKIIQKQPFSRIEKTRLAVGLSSGSLLERVQSSQVFQLSRESNPDLVYQDVVFVIKYLFNSEYRQEFLSFVDSEFQLPQRKLIYDILNLKPWNMNQIYYIKNWPMSFSQILGLIRHSKRYRDLSSQTIARMFSNLFNKKDCDIRSKIQKGFLEAIDRIDKKRKQTEDINSYSSKTIEESNLDLKDILVHILQEEPYLSRIIGFSSKDIELFLEFVR